MTSVKLSVKCQVKVGLGTELMLDYMLETERDYVTPAVCSNPPQPGRWQAEGGHKCG